MLLWDTGREGGVCFSKAGSLVPVVEEDVGICTGHDQRPRKVPFTHRHAWTADLTAGSWETSRRR